MNGNNHNSFIMIKYKVISFIMQNSQHCNVDPCVMPFRIVTGSCCPRPCVPPGLNLTYSALNSCSYFCKNYVLIAEHVAFYVVKTVFKYSFKERRNGVLKMSVILARSLYYSDVQDIPQCDSRKLFTSFKKIIFCFHGNSW